MSSLLTSRTVGRQEILIDSYAFDRKPELRQFVENGLESALKNVEKRCLVVLGGDGTMLSAIRARHSEGLPFLGINFGSKGFLMNRREAFGAAHPPDEFVTLPYPLLSIVTERAGETRSDVAFNEAQIKTAGGHMVTLDVSLSGHSEAKIRWDGLLIVTPAGTTGYNASAGGPILPHSSKLLVATPLLPFEPKRAAPTVFEDGETVKIRHDSERGQTLSVYADSSVVLEGVSGEIEITVCKAKEGVRLLIPTSELDRWKRRIFEEQGFWSPSLP